MENISRKIAVPLLASALAFGLVSCASLPKNRANPSNVSSATPTRALSPEEAAERAAVNAVKGKSVGDTLTAGQAKAIQHYWQGNALAYQNVDGSLTLIDRTKPLPENVKGDVADRAHGAALQSKANGDPLNGPVVQDMKSSETATGRNLMLVLQLFTFSVDGEYERWTWMVPKIGDGRQYSSREEAIAAATAFLQEHAGNSAGTEIVVVDR